MMALVRVTSVEYLGARILQVTFSDGLVRELDYAGVLDGVFAIIDDDDAFATADVDPVAHTVTWPTGVDLDPDVLHGDREAVSPPRPRLIREYWLQQTS